jgi:hypothetical protein
VRTIVSLVPKISNSPNPKLKRDNQKKMLRRKGLLQNGHMIRKQNLKSTKGGLDPKLVHRPMNLKANRRLNIFKLIKQLRVPILNKIFQRLRNKIIKKIF